MATVRQYHRTIAWSSSSYRFVAIMETSNFSITILSTGWVYCIQGLEGSPPDAKTQHTTPPDSCIITRVSDPGYLATPICMVQCALVLLKEITEEKFKCVHQRPAIFRGSSLIDRLHKNNVKFEVVTEHTAL
ncbi:uncharacterized protein LOC127839514 [Dreissena polymorpha]|uniref:uncharacterized protein LOC127839514 n=1 Tax=Dreissena polymorpha TaxID=45954 RepID=UPI002264BCF8|nr:uncharacterized protein LOC127839514 [Dreissena polymorpha]